MPMRARQAVSFFISFSVTVLDRVVVHWTETARVLLRQKSEFKLGAWPGLGDGKMSDEISCQQMTQK